jgi:hypothetical protein
MIRDDADDVAQHFEAQMRAARMAVPPEWHAGTLVVYRDLRAMTELAHDRARPAESEPAAIFSLQAELQTLDRPGPG